MVILKPNITSFGVYLFPNFAPVYMHQEIIEEIRNGNLQYLDQIYLEVKPSFLSFVKKNFQSISSQEAEDVYQDSIIDLYKNIHLGAYCEGYA